MKKTLHHRLIKLSLVTMFACSSLSAELPSSSSVDTSALKESSVSSNVDAQLEKIYDGVREFHIFKTMYNRWSGTDTFTTLVTGQNGFPVFSARSDKDPRFTDYPIDYSNKIIGRYHPVRPPESVNAFYSDKNIELGDKETATYNAPIVSAGTIGKGRVIAMGSHLYGSILVNSRNYSSNYSNSDSDTSHTPDSADMENFFHNVMAWLTEQNPNENKHYKKNGSSISILSNKVRTMFWHTGGATYERDSEAFVMDERYNVTSGENPKIVPTWKEAFENGDLDPSKYPMIIVEDFKRVSSWTRYWKSTKRKTQLDEVEVLIDYVRKGGGLLIMDSPAFAQEEGVSQTAGSEILKKAGITTFFANNKSNVKILPNKTEVGGIDEFDMCLLDYISHTDLQRRLGLDDYTNVPKSLDGLKSLLDSNGNINYLEEVLSRRKREIFSTGNSSTTLTQADCGKVELELDDGSKANVQTTLVKGDGIVQNGESYDKYAKYPVDLNFVQAQGDVGGSMNTLLAHELKEKSLSTNDLNREYTNMSALLLNDATFTGEKFQSLNNLMKRYKTGGQFVNGNGEFYPGFSFTKNDVLDFRRKPVTRIMVERAFYDKSLKYDPSEFPGQRTSTGGSESATIYLKRETSHQKWYAGNMQSTGVYAPAHTDVTITLPDNVDEHKMQLQIGVGDNVGGIFRHEISLKRPPKYVKKYKFINSNGASTKTITVQHPYGGLVFLKSFDNTQAEDAKATVTFTGVQKALRFVLGETSESEWNALRASAMAPKAELESKHHIITVAKANMASLSFEEVTQLAEAYDQEAKNAYDFYGYDKTCEDSFNEHTPPSCSNEKKIAHKHREVFDPHISIGSGHSGYPVMVMSWSPTKTSFPQNPKNSWLLWHEMGHNMVESWLGIAGAGEVANNVMALHQQKRFGLNLKTSSSISNVGIVLGKGQPWADGGNSGRLLMFHQLPKWIEVNYMSEFKEKNPKYYENGEPKAAYPFLDGDGFDIYKILHREARDKTAEDDKYDICMKQSGATKTDMLALCTSAILELDTKPFLQAWRAGVVGIGNVDGQNIYDSRGGISTGLTTGSYPAPSPSIESFSGN